MAISPSPVTREQFEQLWSSVAVRNSNPCAGLFGPSSISWKVNRESALFLGAGRASLLQLAHPWVAAALDQHSSLRSDPLARFHNTFRVIFTMVFGTCEQALAASRYLYQLHTRIEGKLPEAVAAHPRGAHYQANEVNALLWVYATLVESALIAYESVLPPLAADEREAYYTESKTMAALFGIPAAALPADWPAFESYTHELVSSDTLGVSPLSRDLAQRVLYGRGSWVPVPSWYRALTATWMPGRLRAEFALTYGNEEEAKTKQALRWLPRIYPRLPAAARFVGPYHEASARLSHVKAGPLTRASNRFWMGQPRMMFTEPDKPPNVSR